MTTKEALIVISLLSFIVPLCLGNTSGLYNQQLRIEVNETQTVVNLNLQVVKLGCLPIPDIRAIIVTRIIFRKVRFLQNEDVICASNPNALQIEQVARDFMGRIRRECTTKMTTCTINVESLLAYSSEYNNIPNMRSCLSLIDWTVTHACVSKARMFGNECQKNSALTVNNPFNLSAARTYGFVMSPGYPFWQPSTKDCFWKVDQPDNRYTYLALYDIDLNWTGYQLRLRENTANGWVQFFFDDSFQWINSTLTTWQKPVDYNATAVRIGIVQDASSTPIMKEQRGFLLYYEVQYFCTHPNLKTVWESKNVKWPPLVTGNYLMAQCDMDHVFSGTSLKMKTTQCVGKDWSPTLDVLIGAEGCRSTEGGGAVQEDLSRGSILGIIFGSLAAFLLLIGAVTLLTLKRKYHTFFPCCRKRNQKGRLPVAVQPKHTPSNASSTVYAAGFGRSESDRSNATTYTMLSNPYGPTTKPISNSPDILAASTQYAPVLKPVISTNPQISAPSDSAIGISASAPASQYAPTSVVSNDSYGECSVYGGSLRSEYLPMHAKTSANASARLQPAPDDDDETEKLYEDPVRSPPPKHTSSSDEEYEHPISSSAPAPPANKPKAKPAPAPNRRGSEDDNAALDEAGDRIPLAPAPQPPTSAKSKPAAPRVEKKTPPTRLSEAMPDSEPPPPPAPKVKPIKANSDVPERPPKPLPKSSSNATRDSGEYIDFKDSSASASASAASHRESAM